MSKHHHHDHKKKTDEITPELEAIEKMKNLYVSESSRIQDQNKNTPTGNIIDNGTTDARIEIVKHATPAVDAAIRGMENVEKATGEEVPEGHETAPTGHDYTSGNSITGETKPKPFAPWDDAKAKDDKAKEELIENRDRAAKPATDKGQLKEAVDPANAQKDGFKKAGKQ